HSVSRNWCGGVRLHVRLMPFCGGSMAMSTVSSSAIRCGLFAALAAAAAFINTAHAGKEIPMSPPQSPTIAMAPPSAADKSIRPFTVRIPDEKLAELRRRILATQWPEKETVADDTQGVPLAMMQELARYWATDYDWRKAEARLNAYPQFVTNI